MRISTFSVLEVFDVPEQDFGVVEVNFLAVQLENLGELIGDVWINDECGLGEKEESSFDVENFSGCSPILYNLCSLLAIKTGLA